MSLETHAFRILVYDLNTGRGEYVRFGDRREIIGGSGLAAALFDSFGANDLPAFDPVQPLIFAIGPLTGCFPLMSKAICAFKSPYNQQYAEAHAGGRLALAMRFAHIDALVVKGRAATPSCLVAGIKRLQLHDVHPLWGRGVFATGKAIRKMFSFGEGHRSILRIGPAGENLVAYAGINVDSFRHFGRLGAGAVMGAKNLKAIVIDGASSMPAPEGKEYNALFKEIYQDACGAEMRKYHDLGTPANLITLNKIRALPWNNLQNTSDEAIDEVSGETFARELLLRKFACAGCPVGCIHVGLLREMFADQHEFLYRQVAYDYEPIFSAGTMLGLKKAGDVLAVLDEIEHLGLDAMSAGVALAWATEALEKGDISESDTIVPLRFGDAAAYIKAVDHLARRTNDFYRVLGQGALAAGDAYGGADYACVLGQEMAGYATGPVFYVSQALAVRHSHLDVGGYAFDQKYDSPSVQEATDFMVKEERSRIVLTSMVSCLFARSLYSEERVVRALTVMGYGDIADNLDAATRHVQALRWKLKFDTGFDPETVRIPKRFHEVENWKGKTDVAFMDELKKAYGAEIRKIVA
ncbi:aldehyde ferredoxin oxidoreductase N-terminal domain-containing protein [Roseovarius pacificus]|uniref:aldehyde ferredoxin oxidoreductase N-terminal domain-containing protein n=1 Tax=Roseovarius pacificus TaxID=337701 RepID=UPI002A189F19|nr:aldehyde ferredoxin oxidoreductase N-terminal domain-containing protein [Roseovarius pacificus]